MTEIEQEIIRLVYARSEALVKRDLDTLTHILHPDFIYTSSHGIKSNRAEFLARFASSGPVWERQDISELEVHVHGQTAIVSCRVRDVMTWESTHFDAPFRATFVYIQTAEGWRCLAGHSSAINA